ncbi:MAG: class I SAM-dependent methyltransferase [Flavobacteriales bacterium]|nr:class I SAM-dependent methyltransferase [Flavobacteriales bacterium]
MIGELLNRTLRPLGFRLERIKPKGGAITTIAGKASSPWLEKLSASPLDAGLHLEQARWLMAQGNPNAALAESLTAAFLGAPMALCNALQQEAEARTRPLLDIPHNRYYRLHSMAQAIKRMAAGEQVSVLDVGGGDGTLGRFLPGHQYCLAEPVVNGIAGEKLPFPPRSFDIVVSGHVLEHVPRDQRTLFLERLVGQARRGVILLNPFHVEGVDEEERLRLVIRLSGAAWAREHLECVLPKVHEVEAFAHDRGLTCRVTPNGTMASTFGFVWVEYFARRAGDTKALHELNRYMNTRMMDHLDSEARPTAHLVEITGM